MLYTITVLDSVSARVTVYKSVDLKGMDAEDWLEQNTGEDLPNCQWMVADASIFILESVDNLDTDNKDWAKNKFYSNDSI